MHKCEYRCVNFDSDTKFYKIIPQKKKSVHMVPCVIKRCILIINLLSHRNLSACSAVSLFNFVIASCSSIRCYNNFYRGRSYAHNNIIGFWLMFKLLFIGRCSLKKMEYRHSEELIAINKHFDYEYNFSTFYVSTYELKILEFTRINGISTIFM